MTISIDTSKSSVAAAALDAGAAMVNDVTALRGDPEMKPLVARRGVPVVLMHMRGTPKTMQKDPHFADTIGGGARGARGGAGRRAGRGHPDAADRPRPRHRVREAARGQPALVRDLARIRELGCAVLIGLSRKSFLGVVTGRPVEERLASTIAANTIAVLAGADIVRVHDVAAAVDMVRVVAAVRSGGASC